MLWFIISKQAMQKATDDKGHPSPYCSYLLTLNHVGVREVHAQAVAGVGEKGTVAFYALGTRSGHD